MTFNKFLYRLVLIITLAVLSVTYSSAQSKKSKKEEKKAALAQMIDSKKFVFIAQSANPMGGRFINLTSLYDVRLTGDSVISDLPYFGRAFVAPISPTESPLRFNSTNFSYNIKERKKGGWDITISPQDGKDVRQMFLNVSESGYATLMVTSNNRQPISFNGVIAEKGRR